METTTRGMFQSKGLAFYILIVLAVAIFQNVALVHKQTIAQSSL